VVLSALLLLVSVAAALTLLLIPLVREGTDLVQSLPRILAKVDERVEQYRHDFPWLERVWPSHPAPAQGEGASKAPQIAKKALFTLSSVIEGGATALAVFFLGLFLAWNPERWLRGVAELWPGAPVEERIELLRKIGVGLRSYLFTLAVYIVLMGAAWALGLWLIGIRYPLLFGAIGGLAEVVPYVGPMVGLLPPLLIAVSAGPGKILAVVVLYAILHIVEGYLLVPFLMHRGTHLPPPIVVLSILVFGTLFGALGVVLAVPLGTAAYVWVNETVYGRNRSDSHLISPTAHAA
jgi:predicted PurR-regulated permease PerM